MCVEKLLVKKMTAFLYKHKVTVEKGILEEIAEECVEEWELEDKKDIEALRFDYFPAEDDDDDDTPEIWVYNGFRDISFDLATGESTGSGGGVL